MPRLFSRLTVALGLGAMLAGPLPAAEGDPGAYLAARTAETASDFRQAAAWFGRALLADPGNGQLLDATLFANVNLGQIEQAAALARSAEVKPGESQLVDFSISSGLALEEDYDGLAKELAAGRRVGPLFDALALGWAEVGQGRMNEALAQFDKIARRRGAESFGLLHKALALATAGDFEAANAILTGQKDRRVALSGRGILAAVQILSQLERNQDALALLNETFGDEQEPSLDRMRERLASGEAVPFDVVRNARDGVAEAYYGISALLAGEADPAVVLMNARVALALRPDHKEALLLAAAVLEQLDQHDLSVELYSGIAREEPVYYNAQMGRAEALYSAGRKDEAIETLRQLAADFPKLTVVQASLGEMLRREQRWEEAIKAYDAAIALVGDRPQEGDWMLYFSRGICFERLSRYDESEADMRAALRLRPGQPETLNYLGYTMLERRKNIPEALAMIKEAVAAQPENGAFVDSLAWGYFLTGDYAAALEPMEKAALLEPVDPVVTDHLGDVYWMNGREREARFQWRRALSFNPDEKLAESLRRKLERGLEEIPPTGKPQN